jgi:hypothetical protein
MSDTLAQIGIGFLLVGTAITIFEAFVHCRTAQVDEFGLARPTPRFVFRMRAAAVLLAIGGGFAMVAYALEHFL